MAPKKPLEYFNYHWGVQETESSTIIQSYGVTIDNKSVYVKIIDYKPFFYIEIPETLSLKRLDRLILEIANLCGNDDDPRPIDINLVRRRKLYYANKIRVDTDTGIIWKDKMWNLLLVTFRSTAYMRRLINKLTERVADGTEGKKKSVPRFVELPGIGKYKFKIHEIDGVSPVIKLQALRKIASTGWIFAGGKCVINNKESYCDIEMVCEYNKINPSTRKTILHPVIACMDIEANSSVTSAMPNSNKPDDCVFQISVVKTSAGILSKHLLTLGHPDPVIVGKDVDVIEYKCEAELLIGFSAWMRQNKINIVIGYNIMGWDWKYMIERSKYHNCLDEVADQGWLRNHRAPEIGAGFESSAYGAQKLVYLDAAGILFIDLLPVIKRSQPLANYRLATVTKHYGIQTKDDLSAQGIFKCWRENTPSSLGLVGKYCVTDSYITMLLFNKLQMWYALCEMSSTSQVPIIYLYTKGTQIQMYSQSILYCMYNNYIINSDGYESALDDEYLGAIVLDPKPGNYRKVLCFDFASLYPSIMRAYNIDYSSFVDDDNIPDEYCHVFEWDEHQNCEHDDTRVRKKNGEFSTAKCKIVCNHRRFRFMKAEFGGKGMIPILLETMLNARAATRAEIKLNTKTCIRKITEMNDYASTTEISGLLNLFSTEYADIWSDIDLVAGNKQATQDDILKFQGEFETVMNTLTYNNVLDKRQLAYKICANSMYGAMGVKRGYLPLLPGAMCVTYRGREAIKFISTYIPEKFGGKTVYGDSVTGDTPILIRSPNSVVNIITIKELGRKWYDYDVFKQHDTSCIRKNKQQSYVDCEVFTNGEFSKCIRVIRHLVNKKIVRVNTLSGSVDVTEDHSLLLADGTPIKPYQVEIGTQLLHSFPTEFPDHDYQVDPYQAFIWGLYLNQGEIFSHTYNVILKSGDYDVLCAVEEYILHKFPKVGVLHQSGYIIISGRDFYTHIKHNFSTRLVPVIILNSNIEVRSKFWNGFSSGCDNNKFSASSKVLTQQLWYIAQSCGINMQIEYNMDLQTWILKYMTSQLDVTKITSLFNISHNYTCDYVYDIETSSGVFQAGIGNIVVKNTDSAMISFGSGATHSELIKLAQDICIDIAPHFPFPMKLEFEKIYWRYLILTKKRYMAQIANRQGEIVDFTKKGVVLVRRDNCAFLKKIYETCSMYMLDNVIETDKALLWNVVDTIKKLTCHSNQLPRSCAEIVTRYLPHNTENIINKVECILQTCVEMVIELFTRKYPTRDFVLSKSIGSTYQGMLFTDYVRTSDNDKDLPANKLPAHVQLARRMTRRGVEVAVGSRIEYIFTTRLRDETNPNQGDKIEDIDHFQRNRQNYRVDYLYYLKKQVVNPVDDLLVVSIGVVGFMNYLLYLHELKARICREIESLNKCQILFDDEVATTYRPKRVTKIKKVTTHIEKD